ncbi:MAG: hypothetical protein CMF74_08935 [Maricaulis sp.]|mgnify:FL=1|jgi:uncharacterized membrane protein YczE|nr:hypothetical protein [Maricaulis sp.]
MLIRRLTQLYAGLTAFGLAMALNIRSGLGLNPWDVFHQGMAQWTGLSFGTVVIAVGVAVFLAWIPLRQKPGLGTVSNIIVIGLAVDLFLAVLPPFQSWPVRIAALASGIVLCGLATAAYIGAGFGPGPRDGLMTGLAKRTGWSIRLVRTGIEIVVLAAGWALGGTAGIGTVLFAVAIGPLVQAFLPFFDVAGNRPPPAGRRKLA